MMLAHVDGHVKTIPERLFLFLSALFSLFICVTQDGWVTIFKEFQAKGGAVYYGGMLYFSVSIMVGSFVFANLIVASVVTNLVSL